MGNENRLRSEAGRQGPNAPLILEALAKGYNASFRWQEALDVLDQLFTLVHGQRPGAARR
ncbi:MAG: hypothetical protein U0797_07375 [Gemmataceae bacterium]